MIVPVRNEAENLQDTLAALGAQCEPSGGRLDPCRYEVIVLANNCSDASAERVRHFAARRPSCRLQVVEVTFPPSLAHVGHARRVLMDEACRRLEATAGAGGVIVSTDGDTRVAPDWLAQLLAAIGAGADAVGGRLELDATHAEDAPLACLARRDDAYRNLLARLEHALDPDPADPWPRHHQHFAASLALTVHAYRLVGGLPVERFLEDEALYRALRMRDLAVRHSPQVRAVTSSRREGRVEVGLSWQLQRWATLLALDPEADPPVADPRDQADEWALRRAGRLCWQALREAAPAAEVGRTDAPHRSLPRTDDDARLDALAAACGTGRRWVRSRIAASTSFGVFWGDVVGQRLRVRPRPPSRPPVPMREAIALLRQLISDADAGAVTAAVASRTGRAGPAGGVRRSGG